MEEGAINDVTLGWSERCGVLRAVNSDYDNLYGVQDAAQN